MRYGLDVFYIVLFMELRRIERLDSAQAFARELSAFNRSTALFLSLVFLISDYVSHAYVHHFPIYS
jgi:hypothetical protein